MVAALITHGKLTIKSVIEPTRDGIIEVLQAMRAVAHTERQILMMIGTLKWKAAVYRDPIGEHYPV